MLEITQTINTKIKLRPNPCKVKPNIFVPPDKIPNGILALSSSKGINVTKTKANIFMHPLLSNHIFPLKGRIRTHKFRLSLSCL